MNTDNNIYRLRNKGDKLYLNGNLDGKTLINKEAIVVYPDVPQFANFDVWVVVELDGKQYRLFGSVYDHRIDQVHNWPLSGPPVWVPCKDLSATVLPMDSPPLLPVPPPALPTSQVKNAISKFLDNKLKELQETQGHEGEEIEFECACVDGKYKVVEKMLVEVPYLSRRVSYLQNQIEFVKEERTSVGRTKVVEILKQKIAELKNTLHN